MCQPQRHSTYLPSVPSPQRWGRSLGVGVRYPRRLRTRARIEPAPDSNKRPIRTRARFDHVPDSIECPIAHNWPLAAMGHTHDVSMWESRRCGTRCCGTNRCGYRHPRGYCRRGTRRRGTRRRGCTGVSYWCRTCNMRAHSWQCGMPKCEL